MLIKDLKVGNTYLSRLSDRTILVIRVTPPSAKDSRYTAVGKYYNHISGLFVTFAIEDGELLVENTQSTKY